MTTPSVVHDTALHALEAALRALKLAHGSHVTLKKHGTPFPLAVTRAVQPPAAYAVPALFVRVVLADADFAAAAETAAVEVELQHAPQRLLAAIRAQVAARWRQLAHVAGAARVGDAVGLLGDWADSNFAALVSQFPTLLERIELPGPDDTTVRCFVFVTDEEEEEVKPEPEPPATAAPERSASPPTVQPEAPPTVAPALEAELSMASRRYSALRWVTQSGGGCSLSVDVTPLDPQWRAAGLPSLLRLEGRAPGDFPTSATVLEPVCAALHPRLAERVARGLAVEASRLCGQRNALRALLAYAADHAGRLSFDDEGDTSGSEAEGEEDSESSDDEHAFRPTAGAVDGAGAAGALTMSFTGLELGRIDCLEAATALLACRCSRCDAVFEASWRVEAQPAGVCVACAARWRLTMRPRLAHAASPVLAWLAADGCAAAEALRFDVVVGCSGCGASAVLRGATPAHPVSRNCSRCHAQLTLRFAGVTFAAAVASAAARAQQRPRRAGPRTGPAAVSGGIAPGARGGLTPGAPLPGLGACRHYAHSHRWLRFPCCGRLFPCDVCHELAPALSDRCASAPWAPRMACGFCSREQPSAGIDGRCCSCGRRVAGGAGVTAAAGSRPGAHHWEGGRGCRDRTRLSRVRDFAAVLPPRLTVARRMTRTSTRAARARHVAPKAAASGRKRGALGPGCPSKTDTSTRAARWRQSHRLTVP